MKSYMTIAEATEYFDIHRSTLAQWEKMGLKRVQIGKRVFYDAKDIESFMDDHKECLYQRN